MTTAISTPGLAQTFVPAPATNSTPTLQGTPVPPVPGNAVPGSAVPATPTSSPATSPPGNSPPPVPAQTYPQAPGQSPVRTLIPAPASPAATTEDDYILGAGDQIQIDIFNVPEFSGAFGRYTILVDGSATFPWIGRVMLAGQTLDQAGETLTRRYSEYIRDLRTNSGSRLLTVNLIAPRSLKISVVGEVKRPGSYIVNPDRTNNQTLVTPGGAGGNGGGTVGEAGAIAGQWPSVTQALQSAGGITQQADLRRVQIRRPEPNGGQQLIDVNLWELLRSGQLSQDISMRDGDTLIVPTATDLNSQEALVLGSASFSPATIRVNVVGEVKTPGPVELSPNTPLNQAIMAAGGFVQARANRSRVELVRLNPNGTAMRREVKLDLASGISDETNPALRDYDTIIVRRNGLTSTAETLTTILSPLGALLGPLGAIFGLANTF